MLTPDRLLILLIAFTLRLPFAMASGATIRCENFFYLPEGTLLVSGVPASPMGDASREAAQRRRQYQALMEADIRATQGVPPLPEGVREDLRELAAQALIATRSGRRVTIPRPLEVFISRASQIVSSAETYAWPNDLRETVAQNSGFVSWQELASLFAPESPTQAALTHIEDADQAIWASFWAGHRAPWGARPRGPDMSEAAIWSRRLFGMDF